MQKEFVTVTPDNGGPGEINVNFQVSKNSGLKSRNVEINILSKKGSILKKINVSQRGAIARIKINKTDPDPSTKVKVEGDFSQMLSEFRRCLCKKVSDNNVKICFLQNNNSNYYHDGSPSKLDSTEGDVMVYFPEMWVLGSDTDSEWVFNFSMSEQPGYKHIPASLVGVYLSYTNVDFEASSDSEKNVPNGKLYSRGDVYFTGYISPENLSSQARNRGKGYHLIDYQQHCIIALMQCAKYKNTNSELCCGNGERDVIMRNGSTSNLGNNDTTPDNAGNESNVAVNFLGIETCWSYNIEQCIEGIHLNEGDGNLLIYDKGEYFNKPYNEIQSTTKRIIQKSELSSKSGYISHIIGGENMDLIPTNYTDNYNTYFCGYFILSDVYNRFQPLFRGAKNVFAIRISGYQTPQDKNCSRLAFDGNIEIVDDVNTFKSLPVL